MRFSGRLLWGYGGLLIFSSLLLIVYGKDHSEDDKSKKNPDKASSFSNVLSNSIEYGQDACQVAQCLTMKVKQEMLQLEQHRGSEISTSQQPTCNPVFKRFVTNLLKEIEKLGLPMSVTAKKHYDAKVKLSKKMVAEIQKIVNDGSRWRTGALDEALSQILINIRLYDKEARKWRFEDTFGVKPDSVIKVSAIVLIIVLIICTEMWSVVSWFVQLKRMFAIWFIITLVWNWFYLYKKAFDEHQADILNRMNVSDTCAGLKDIYWWHNFKEWFQITNMWTLQDAPCKQYYEAVIVNPVLLVSPMKAISMTITTFITEILKHIGQGVNEFLRALLKDLPVTHQIPMLLLIGLFIVVFIYTTGQAAVQHAVLGPLHLDPPPAIGQQAAGRPLLEPEERE